MYQIDRIVGQVDFLANDFFRHAHRWRRLKVFLCGRRPDNKFNDLRYEVKHLLTSRMGCEVKLGEDIAGLDVKIKSDADYLTIEVGEAEQSDLVVIFLGSAGTISEVTAFAMRPQTRQKVIVFNEAAFRDVESFVNCGPLRMLPPDRIIYYEARSERPTMELVTHLDRVVAEAWFRKLRNEHVPWFCDGSFPTMLALAVVNACHPVSYRDLARVFGEDETPLRRALGALIHDDIVAVDGGRYVPGRADSGMVQDRALRRDVSRVRLRVMGKRLKSAPSATACSPGR
jgi:hypothetical protein